MKKLFIISAIVLSCIGTLEAQFIHKPQQVYKSYLYDDGELYLPMQYWGTFYYNDQGLIKKFQSYHKIGNNWGESYYQKNYWYDNASRRIKYSYSGYDSGGMFNTDSIYYWYNDNQLSHTLKMRVDKWGGYYYTDSTDYHYDNEARLSQVEHYVKGIESTDWSFNGTTDYSETEDGTEKVVINYSSSNIVLSRDIRHYNLIGQLLDVFTEKFNTSGQLISKDSITYEYENELVSSKLKQKWSIADNCWVNDSNYVFHYNSQGIQTEQITQIWIVDDWQNAQYTHWDADDEGIIQSITYEEWIDNEFINSRRVEYQYDDEGLCIGLRGLIWSDEGWIIGTAGQNGVGGHNERIFWDNSLSFENNLIQELSMGFSEATITWQTLYLTYSLCAEWYYEILNDNGSITYQHLECVGDTVMMSGKRPKVIVRSNTHYDRDTITEVTHEYVYEEDGIVYWWNRDLQEFTMLYNLNANVGDEWEIKVGTKSLTMHVDSVENVEYEGRIYRVLHVSDSEDLFSGDIVCNIGHMTSFFPERLMNRGKGYRVEGLRCYWVDDELVYKMGDEDCDAIYEELHHGIEEQADAAAFAVYPNPAKGILVVETQSISSLPTANEYRITNLMGQTLLQGRITAETQQIDIESLTAGMYFLTMEGETMKFVVR
jgi:hypothetical protein